MRHLPSVDPIRLDVFTKAEALDCGWSIRTLKSGVGDGFIERLRPGVFRPVTDPPTNRFDAARERLHIAAVAGALANPSACVTHQSAAVVRGLAVWRTPELPCLTVPPRFVGDIAGAHLHRAAFSAAQFEEIGGIKLATVEQTVIDTGREHRVLAALVVADAALHLRRTSQAQLEVTLRQCRGWPGVRRARAAIEQADGRSESPLETASRYLVRDVVPAFDIQTEIYSPAGVFLGRADAYWDDFGVVGEADGMAKYDPTDEPVLRKEKKRQKGFEDTGLVVFRWDADDLQPIDRLAHKVTASIELALRLKAPRRWLTVPTDRVA